MEIKTFSLSHAEAYFAIIKSKFGRTGVFKNVYELVARWSCVSLLSGPSRIKAFVQLSGLGVLMPSALTPSCGSSNKVAKIQHLEGKKKKKSGTIY